MIVFLERGAATGGVGEDGVKVFAEERGNIFSGKVASDIANAGMGGEGAAAKLAMGHDDFAAVGGENANSGFVEPRESDVGDAAGEERDAGAAGADGGEGLAEAREEKRIIDAREEAFAISETEELEDAAGARERLQPGTLIDAEKTRSGRDARWKRKQMTKDETAHSAGEKWATVAALDFCARVFDELAVFHARGAGGFAGTAVEALVNVLDEGIGDGLMVQFDVNHLADAPARRICFKVPEAVGGAGVETEAAVSATREIFVNGGGAGDESRMHTWVCGRERFYGSYGGVAREEWWERSDGDNQTGVLRQVITQALN
jgi:hypothetical protein